MDSYVYVIEKAKCTGCGTCKNICPAGAIFMEADAEGFGYPVIKQDICVHCGKCTDVCPVSDTAFLNRRPVQEEKVNVYAAWSRDQNIRYHSTSGGIFSELAAAIIGKGGYVCGAAYDGRQMVHHRMVHRMEDLGQIRQSKYVQSDMGDTYHEISGLLREGTEVLFCGTPCQCAGVFRYCRKEGIATGQLYLVDFICRGSNSPKVYRKFLDELEERYQSKAERVWFKNKAYGWNRFSTKIEFENGSCYLEDRYHDVYIRGYIEENLYIRPSCSDCRFKGLQRCSDITLADFWGVRLEGKMQESDGGTSMVMLHSEKGRKLWDGISSSVFYTEKKLEDVVPGNICFGHSAPPGIHRAQFMRDLDRMPVIRNIERFLEKREGREGEGYGKSKSR